MAAPTATEPTTADKTATDKLYEGMFLLDSGRFATDSKAATDQIIGMIEKCGGTIVAHRPWQDGRLAYAINGHRKGLHYLTYFKLKSGDGIRELTRACKLSDLVLRHVVILHPQAMFDAMVQAISGEWHPHEAAQDDGPRGRDRDRGERGDRDRGDRDRGERDRGPVDEVEDEG